jgi:hypothetical protein
VTFVVDPSMYGARYAPPREVYGNLDRVVRPDLYYHYSTPICAQRWLDVCEDPAYGHGALLGRVTEIMPEVTAALSADSGGRSRAALCSLGPGDGSVDERILGGLSDAFDLVSYTGLDFSFELLRRCVHRIAAASGPPPDLPIHAVCGDFTDLGSVTLPRRPPDALRVFALTGFTFGNYTEDRLLRDIGRLMGEGDYLLLDARLHALGPLPDDPEAVDAPSAGAAAHYDAGTVRRFVLGPVEVATTAATDDVRISFELSHALTTVPNALNLVIYCSGLDATMRLTGERIRRDRLDLAVTTSYHLPDLASWLGKSGLTTVWQGSNGDLAFFLMRR